MIRASLAALLLSTSVLAQEIRPLPVPENAVSAVWGMNDWSQMVGNVYPQDGTPPYAFRYSHGELERIARAGFTFLTPLGISFTGEIAGYIGSLDAPTFAFIRARSGRFIDFRVPNAGSTVFHDVNSFRVAVGFWTEVLPNTDFRTRGLVVKPDGRWQSLDNPFGGYDTVATAINDWGIIVGHYGGPEDSPRHGFILEHGRWRTLDYPGASSTRLNDIAFDGTIAGLAEFPEEPYRLSFLYRRGRFIALAPQVEVFAVNSFGIVAGWTSEAKAFYGPTR